MLRRLAPRRTWLATGLAALLPLVLIGLAVGVFLVANPIPELQPGAPVEQVAFERTVFTRDGIRLEVRNDGLTEVTIAQVLVNDAFWDFTITQRTLSRLEATTIDIPYPWEAGRPIAFALLTSTGATLEHEVEAAAPTPRPEARSLLTYGALGTWIGLLPVGVGLLWLPALRRAQGRWVELALAFTLGLLTFLLIDTISEGLGFAAATAETLDGVLLFAISGLAAALGLAAVGDLLQRRATPATQGMVDGLGLAYVIALAIGLHNAGEGLAVGAALAAGEVALGTSLVVGFAIHNVTEGLAIITPLRWANRPAWWHFPALALLAGGPAAVGAVAGGFALSPAWAAIAFGVAAGTIAQVLWSIGASVARTSVWSSNLRPLGFLGGLAFMYATGLLTA